MIENSADYLPIWMLLSAAFGFIIGDAFADCVRKVSGTDEAAPEEFHAQTVRGELPDLSAARIRQP
jgi:hypothetical protein